MLPSARSLRIDLVGVVVSAVVGMRMVFVLPWLGVSGARGGRFWEGRDDGGSFSALDDCGDGVGLGNPRGADLAGDWNCC